MFSPTHLRLLRRWLSPSTSLLIRMLTTTTISPVDAPVTAITENKSYPPHLRHALIIDLDPTSKLNPDEYLAPFLGHLRATATQPIDILHFLGGTPSSAIWEALQDLKYISHLEMSSGYDEYCNIEPLDRVGSAWPLKSIAIGSACGEDITTAHINTIDSLALDYCCGLSFPLATRNSSSKLKRLTIIENDACDHFLKLREESCLLSDLSELKIVSTNGCDFCHQYEEKDFGEALVQCHSLISLDLSLSVPSTEPPEANYLIGLPTFFPPNIEILQFRGPPTLGNNLSVWHKCASDLGWLPNLKSIKFCLDVIHRGEEVVMEKASLAHDQSMQFLKHLVSLRPSIIILNEQERASTNDS